MLNTYIHTQKLGVKIDGLKSMQKRLLAIILMSERDRDYLWFRVEKDGKWYKLSGAIWDRGML